MWLERNPKIGGACIVFPSCRVPAGGIESGASGCGTWRGVAGWSVQHRNSWASRVGGLLPPGLLRCRRHAVLLPPDPRRGVPRRPPASTVGPAVFFCPVLHRARRRSTVLVRAHRCSTVFTGARCCRAAFAVFRPGRGPVSGRRYLLGRLGLEGPLYFGCIFAVSGGYAKSSVIFKVLSRNRLGHGKTVQFPTFCVFSSKTPKKGLTFLRRRVQ